MFDWFIFWWTDELMNIEWFQLERLLEDEQFFIHSANIADKVKVGIFDFSFIFYILWRKYYIIYNISVIFLKYFCHIFLSPQSTFANKVKVLIFHFFCIWDFKYQRYNYEWSIYEHWKKKKITCGCRHPGKTKFPK